MGGVSITADPNSSNSTLTPPSQQDDGHSENVEEEEEENEEELKEEGECGFCLFMKAGPCGESFTAWEQCIKESEKSKEYAAAKCIEVFKTLNECMKEHQDYYDLYLRAEKAELKKEEASKSELREQSRFDWGFY